MKEKIKTKAPRKRTTIKKGYRCLGPISNLEEYLQPDWWRRIFNSIYLKTDADVVDDQYITKTEINMFSSILKLSTEDRILDLCCGQGRHSLELARRGFQNVEGLDRSHYLIQKAKAYAKKEGLSVKFREGDARKIPYLPDTFNVVMILGNSFGYFETIQDDLRVLKEVYRILKPWGRVVIDTADGEYLKENFQPRSWEWIDKKYFVCRERSLSLDKQRLISREVVTHVSKGVVVDQFYAERLYTQKDLSKLLETAGFNNIIFQGEISPKSQRNQDLGMMGRRIIVMGTVRKEWTPVKIGIKKTNINVGVILGDHRKPDKLKPSGIFDDDDFYTIDQLKGALRELKKFQFVYFDNHDSLIHNLLKMKPKIDIVFNLCDEGYNNEAKKELHIPALLEMLDIPYTGSAPQCLAYCYDKSLVRGIAKEMEIPVPQAFFIKKEDTTFNLPFGFPVIVKPNFGDSSMGITQKSVTNTIEELINAISKIREDFGYDKDILVEKFLTGKDLSVGIIGNSPEDYRILPIIQADYSTLLPELPKICGYESKWVPDSPYWSIKSKPANLPEDVEKVIIEYSLKLFERLECRDYCRLDWRLDGAGNPKLLEVNPNPGWCWDGHLAKMAEIEGISYREMLKYILESAIRRQRIVVTREGT